MKENKVRMEDRDYRDVNLSNLVRVSYWEGDICEKIWGRWVNIWVIKVFIGRDF